MMEKEISANRLYEWYHEVKKKDLGASRCDWMQHLRKEASLGRTAVIYENTTTGTLRPVDVNNETAQEITEGKNINERSAPVQAESRVDICKRAAEGNQSEELAQKENTHTSSLKHNESIAKKSPKHLLSTPIQEPKSPFSALMDNSFITPTLILSRGNDISTPSALRTPSIVSPNPEVLDIFSPIKSEHNTTEDMARSLGANLDDSAVLWTSALATPKTSRGSVEPHRRASPSTIERLTLLPKQQFLRRKVMARSLFSPRTPGSKTSSSSEEWSPNMGIIKCHSPVPAFDPKLKLEEDKRRGEISDKCENNLLTNATQGFRVSQDVKNRKSLQDIEDFKINCDSDTKDDVVLKMECKDTLTGDPIEDDSTDQDSFCNVLVPSQVLQQCKGSVAKSDVKEQMQESKRGSDIVVTCADREDANTEGTHLKKRNIETFEEEVSTSRDCRVDSSQSRRTLDSHSPFDLICSPVKKKTKFIDENQESCKSFECSDVKALKLEKNHETDEKSANNISQDHKSSDKPEADFSLLLTKTYNIVSSPLEKDLHSVAQGSRRDIYTENLHSLEGEVSRHEENAWMRGSDVVSSSRLKSEGKTNLEDKDTFKINLSSPRLHPVPLFKRNTSSVNEQCLQRRDSGESGENTVETPPAPPKQPEKKGILSKLSLRKTKKSSGRFMYPTRSSDESEIVNMKFKSKSWEEEKKHPVDTKPQDPEVTGDSLADIPATPKCVADIHVIANRQQNFVSLTNLEKDNRLSKEVINKVPVKRDSVLPSKEEVECRDSQFNSNKSPLLPRKQQKENGGDNTLATKTSKYRKEKVTEGVRDSPPHKLYVPDVCEESKDKFVTKATRLLHNQPPSLDLETAKDHDLVHKGHRGNQIKHKEKPGMSLESQVVPPFTLPRRDHYSTGVSAGSMGNMKELPNERKNERLRDNAFSGADNDFSVPSVDNIQEDDESQTLAMKNQLHQHTKSDFQNVRVQRDSSSSEFCGFVTGRGKKVKVNTESLQHAKKLLEEPLEDDMTVHKEEATSLIAKNEVISETHIGIHSKSIASDKQGLERGEYKATAHVAQNVFGDRSKISEMCGFTTAGGSAVRINAAALNRARKLWENETSVVKFDEFQQDASTADQFDMQNSQGQLAKSKAGRFGFKTAGGKTVQVKASSLLKAQKSWQEESLAADIADAARMPQVLSKCNKAQPDIHSGTYVSGLDERPHDRPSTSIKIETGEKMQGFSTASGGQIQVSEEAMKRAKFLLEESESVELNYDIASSSQNIIETDVVFPEQCSPQSPCIKSKRSRVLSKANFVAEKNSKSVSNSLVVGFQTARGGMLNVSNNALLRAETLMNECDSASHLDFTSDDRNDVTEREDRLKHLEPFLTDTDPQGKHLKQTATTEKLVVKDQEQMKVVNIVKGGEQFSSNPVYHSLENSKDEFVDISTCDVNKTVTCTVPGFIGFSTATGRKVEVSQAAVVRAKRLFEEDAAPELCVVPEPSSSSSWNTNCGIVNKNRNIVNEVTSLSGAITDGNFKMEYQDVQENHTSSENLLTLKESPSAPKHNEIMFDNPSSQFSKGKQIQPPRVSSLAKQEVGHKEWSSISSKNQDFKFPLSDCNTSNKRMKTPEETCEESHRGNEFLSDNEDADEVDRSPSPILGSQRGNLRGTAFPASGTERTLGSLTYRSGIKNITQDCTGDLSTEKQHRILCESETKTEQDILQNRSGNFSQPNMYRSESVPSPTARASSLPNMKFKDSIGDQSHSMMFSKVKAVTAAVDTQEISDITEAFLQDESWEREGSTLVRKRSRGSSNEHENVETQKKIRSNATPNEEFVEPSGSIQVYDEVVEAEKELIRLKQEKVIKYKEKQSVQPIQGYLHKGRMENKGKRVILQSLGNLQVLKGSSKRCLEVTAANAAQYRFSVQDERCCIVKCGDGCSVIPGADGKVGVKEIQRGFLATPGVHPGLLPQFWVANHYRWIVWKMAALERRFHGQFLTLENVIARLKYRYDREIDRAERPILRKITEQDDIPQKTMVLCVANLQTSEPSTLKEGTSEAHPRIPPAAAQAVTMDLTDGWYSIGTTVDSAMIQLIHDGKVEVGTKLVIHGAELTGVSSPCHPLEAPMTLRLRLHANMTRRARWWTRLGLLPQQGPLPSLIHATLRDGGLVGKLTVTLVRVYPMLYFERSNGQVTMRGERAHMRLIKESQHQKETTYQQVVTEVERQFECESKEAKKKSGGKSLSADEIRNLTMGRDISQLMEDTLDPSSLEGLLSSHQLELAMSWRQRQAEDRRRKINYEVQRRLASRQKTYEAVPLLKVRVLDSDGASAMVTIWRPAEDLRQALSEGSHFIIHYLLSAGFKKGSLQFTAVRQTRWERATNPSSSYYSDTVREVIPLCLTSSAELKPYWQEVDVVGIVLRVGQYDRGGQMVHLVDHHINIVALKFWGGLKECGVEDLVQIGIVLCVSNGSWRGHSGGRFGCIHITELTAITTSPRSAHLEEALIHIKENSKNIESLLHEGDMKLDGQFDDRAFPSESSSASLRAHPERRRVAVLSDDINEEDNTEDQISKRDIPEQASSDSDAGEALIHQKLLRVEQRSEEVRNKLKALGRYGTPSPLRSLYSPATQRAQKPFRVPFKPNIQIDKGYP